MSQAQHASQHIAVVDDEQPARDLVVAFFAARPAVEAGVFPELTDREREILDLIARGMNNAEITQRLVTGCELSGQPHRSPRRRRATRCGRP